MYSIDMKQSLTFLRPGKLIVTSTPKNIHTILGSCVSVCLWDKASGFSGINHFLLPGSLDDEPVLTFGLYATEQLIEKVKDKAGEKVQFYAKIFGGSNILENNSTIGEENILAAKEVLNKYHIQIIAEDTGGTIRRKIIFETKTGNVHLFTPDTGWRWI